MHPAALGIEPAASRLTARRRPLPGLYHLLRDYFSASLQQDIFSQSAALAYYTVFAIAPLFVVALAIAGFWFGSEAASRELYGQVTQLIGKDGGQAVQTMVAAASKARNGWLATSMAVGTLVVASTGVFVQLQNSLNRFWGVRPVAGTTLRNFIRHRLLSFAMVVGVGFLLIVSLVVSAGLSALGNFLGHFISAQEIILKILNPLISLGLITVMFTMIFKLLPDVKIGWRDVWLGGLITAVLFNVGKFLIGFYIAKSSITSVYGAVGSLAIILVWVYYSSLILFFGAELTRIQVLRTQQEIKTAHGAALVSPNA